MSPKTSGGSWAGLTGFRSEKDVNIDIAIDHHFTSKVYTTGDTIAGAITINTRKEFRFDSVEVCFTGTTTSSIDVVHPHAAPMHHTFLELSLPIEDGCLPDSQAFEVGETCSIPFTFVVPSRLPSGSCHHLCGPELKEKHSLLPPSMGTWEGNDQSPETARVEYAVKVQVAQYQLRNGKHRVVSAQETVNVVPYRPGEGALQIMSNVEKYRLVQGKTIRQGVLSPAKGYLEVSGAQPEPVILSPDSLSTSSFSAHLHLSFTPTSATISPPNISSIKARIISETYFSLTPINCIPNLRSLDESQAWPIMSYSTTHDLALANIPKPIWEQASLLGNSTKSSLGCHGSTSQSKTRIPGVRKRSSREDSIRHVASLSLPLTLPTSKKNFFLSSFHSCFLSRTYTLHLTLAEGPFSTAIYLALPLQVVTSNSTGVEVGELPPYNADVLQRETPNEDPPSYGQTAARV
ncbi:hypothetical protein B0T10DRAFT_548166 [Thelonectria olida]|uniref:Arrestin-like N-terminal domain-containing protein n=1 Tax=Thelonectria olida TaxID=1576542 RepID=A0A9P9AMT1_9HYPO|nr:hypothetical protein B0T10DRAFT_548166 [Thelonectria olida]